MTNFKDYPAGKVQKDVLNALGMTATGFNDANKKFEEIGIRVSSRREGRATVPVVTKLATSGGGWNVGGDGDGWDITYKSADLSKISQWLQ